MRIDRFDNGDEYWTAESLRDFWGWEIIYNEPWTEAVSRLHCRRSVSFPDEMEFRFIYCRNSILREVIEVEVVQ